MNHCNGPVFWDHYEDVRKMQLSTTVKNESCHPIQTFQQRGQVSRGPCCAAMRVVCHCSTWDGMGYTVGTGVATAQKFAQRPTAFPPQHYCYFGQQVYSKKQTPHSHVCTDEFTQTGATYFITIFRFSECSCSSPQKEEAAWVTEGGYHPNSQKEEVVRGLALASLFSEPCRLTFFLLGWWWSRCVLGTRL